MFISLQPCSPQKPLTSRVSQPPVSDQNQEEAAYAAPLTGMGNAYSPLTLSSLAAVGLYLGHSGKSKNNVDVPICMYVP